MLDPEHWESRHATSADIEISFHKVALGGPLPSRSLAWLAWGLSQPQSDLNPRAGLPQRRQRVPVVLYGDPCGRPVRNKKHHRRHLPSALI